MADSPELCQGAPWLFGYRYRGPFNSSTELIKQYKKIFGDLDFDDSQPMVLTHGDLSLRNIMLGHDGKIWLVDWGFSGFYPPWFEYIAAMSAAENDKYMGLVSWWRHIPLVTGAWLKEKAMLGVSERLTQSWIDRRRRIAQDTWKILHPSRDFVQPKQISASTVSGDRSVVACDEGNDEVVFGIGGGRFGGAGDESNDFSF
jgi:hypothetical protein